MCDQCGCCHVPDYGACDTYEAGLNGRCVYCDHSLACHPGKGEFHNGPLSAVRRRKVHHEPQLSKEMAEMFRNVQLGPTGQFPEGELTQNDEGELRLAVGTFKNKVVVNFGTPIASLGMTPAQARDVAKALWKHARSLDGGTKRKRKR